MTLKAFIKEVGVRQVRKELDVDPSAVYNWINATACPRPAHMFKINKMSKGRVSYREMIETFVNAK